MEEGQLCLSMSCSSGGSGDVFFLDTAVVPVKSVATDPARSEGKFKVSVNYASKMIIYSINHYAKT